MPDLTNLLFVTSGVDDDSAALTQAMAVATQTEVKLSALIVCPPLPDGISAYQAAYEAGVRQQFTERLVRCAETQQFDHTKVELSVKLEAHPPPSEQIISFARENRFDLVIKQAEARESKLGFRAKDRALAKTSPCPIWLHHPSRSFNPQARVAVAIDPEAIDGPSRTLSLRLLRVARRIADHLDRKLQVLSCWNYAFEGYLRRNAWSQLPETEIAGIVEASRGKHLTALSQLIEESQIEGPLHIEHLRGLPEDRLPEATNKLGVDLLVLGTAARTGVAGWLLGNTSDDVMQKLSCSVVVLKPRQEDECTTT